MENFWTTRSDAHYTEIRKQLFHLASKHQLYMHDLELALQNCTYIVRCCPLAYFFEDNPIDHTLLPGIDVAIHLEDGQVSAHSYILTRRCPFFKGLLDGFSGGLWVSTRGKEDGLTPIDLTHLRKEPFFKVLTWIYTDQDGKLFQDLMTEPLETYAEKVIDVLAIANELLLEPLAMICQSRLGKCSKWSKLLPAHGVS